MTLTEIANALDAPKSSIKPITDTMLSMGYLRKCDAHLSLFCIGAQAFLVGSAYSLNQSVRDAISERLKRLCGAVGEICQFAVLNGNQVFYLFREEPDVPIKLKSQEMRMLPAYCTGLGKALLADMSLAQLEALYGKNLKKYTDKTVSSIFELYQLLAQYKQEGFFYEHGELISGIECIALPVRADGNVIAAVSVTMLEGETYNNKAEKVKNELLECQKDIEKSFRAFSVTDSQDLF